MRDFNVKAKLAQKLKGGVIIGVTNVRQAVMAEKAGACAVLAFERSPADSRASGQVCRMYDPIMIREIMDAVSIPVLAQCRIGHFVEAQILQELGVDYIDESEVLTPADWSHHIRKAGFSVPFVCGANDLGEALKRVSEGAAMLRTRGEAGTGDISEAIKHIHQIKNQIDELLELKGDDLAINNAAYGFGVDDQLVREVIENNGKLPVVHFAAGGVATPGDAAMCMQLGCDGVFVGSGIFKSEYPEKVAKALVDAVTHYQDAKKVLEVSEALGQLMVGKSIDSLGKENRLATRCLDEASYM